MILQVLTPCIFFVPQLMPTHLTVDFLEHTDREFAGGKKVLIESSRPTFGWMSGREDKFCRLTLERSDGTLVWDSGKILAEQNLRCAKSLDPSTDYQWQVTTWGKGGKLCSQTKKFRTCDFLDGGWSAYPLDADVTHLEPTELAPGVYFVDFVKDAFAQIELVIDSASEGKAIVHLGEKISPDWRIDRNPGGSIRYCNYEVNLKPGLHNYRIELRHDPRNAPRYDNPGNEPPIHMPHHIGEVYPFRYCEIETSARVKEAVRTAIHYPFDDSASSFVCSDSTLNAVWELCKYSIKATSFCGYYVDGDRERIPYEADALINQIGHYCTDREYAMARRSVDYLIDHPTWPTEWILQTPLLAWRDYLYTGDKRLIESRYDDLVAKALISLRNEDGLISTVGKDLSKVHQDVHYHGSDRLRDIVDWPRVGGFGSPGEDDGYQFRPYNTVVNAFHYYSLVMLEKIACALGKTADARNFADLALQTRESLIRECYDDSDGAFFDGIGTDHKSLHATLFPLALGLAPDLNAALEFIHSKGMVCSVYAAQLLLEGLYDNRDSEFALSLLTSHQGRCWWAMLEEGSTISLEAWSKYYKGNLDWNHAWGAAPANIIPRKILGVEPLTPGFGTVRIDPQPGGLDFVEGTVPTPRGPVHVSCNRRPDGTYSCSYTVPAGMEVVFINNAK